MSRHREAHSVGFETLSQCVYDLKKMCVCMCVCVPACFFPSMSVHVQACVCLCVGPGVTGGRYAMSG